MKTLGYWNAIRALHGSAGSSPFIRVTKQAVTQTASPCRTEAFTTKNAEYSESGTRSLMLHLSDLCAPGGCSKPLFDYYTPRCGKMLETGVGPPALLRNRD